MINNSENKTVKKPSRHQTRFVCVQSIISALITNFKYNAAEAMKLSQIPVNQEFFTTLYNLVYEHGAFFTETLTNHIKTKPFSDLAIELQAIFHCAAAELFYVQTDRKVVISEYVIITKRLVGDNHYKLVNKVLDSL